MSTAMILVLIAAVIAVVYGFTLLRTQKNKSRAALKTFPIALLALATFLAGAPPLLTAALVFCAAGDWFLAFEGERNFLLGLASFLVGHLLYTAFFLAGVSLELFLQQELLVVFAFLAAIGLAVNIRLWPHTGALRIPVIFYTLAILAMVLSAKAAAVNQLVLLGVVMFMISDIILARETFLPQAAKWLDRNSDYLVWFLYSAGQVLIVWGLLAPFSPV